MNPFSRLGYRKTICEVCKKEVFLVYIEGKKLYAEKQRHMEKIFWNPHTCDVPKELII